MRSVISILVLIVIGVMLADMVNNATGTKTLFDGVASVWKIGVNGMLGKTTASN